MKRILMIAAAVLAVSTLRAVEAGDFFAHPGRLIAQPDFKSMPGAPWSIAKGKWEAADGVITPTPVKEENHVPVLWHNVAPAAAVIECEFKLDGAGYFIIGCDGKRHIGRVSISPASARITDDSTEVKGRSSATLLTQEKLDLKKDRWYSAKFGWKGDRIYAVVDGHELSAQAPTFAQARSRWWFASPGAHIRNVKVSESQ